MFSQLFKKFALHIFTYKFYCLIKLHMYSLDMLRTFTISPFVKQFISLFHHIWLSPNMENFSNFITEKIHFYTNLWVTLLLCKKELVIIFNVGDILELLTSQSIEILSEPFWISVVIYIHNCIFASTIKYLFLVFTFVYVNSYFVSYAL